MLQVVQTDITILALAAIVAAASENLPGGGVWVASFIVPRAWNCIMPVQQPGTAPKAKARITPGTGMQTSKATHRRTKVGRR
jgi:O-acetyl-ADP-ribose deacetylase (regulator of RNase III)